MTYCGFCPMVCMHRCQFHSCFIGFISRSLWAWALQNKADSKVIQVAINRTMNVLELWCKQASTGVWSLCITHEPWHNESQNSILTHLFITKNQLFSDVENCVKTDIGSWIRAHFHGGLFGHLFLPLTAYVESALLSNSWPHHHFYLLASHWERWRRWNPCSEATACCSGWRRLLEQYGLWQSE